MSYCSELLFRGNTLRQVRRLYDNMLPNKQASNHAATERAGNAPQLEGMEEELVRCAVVIDIRKVGDVGRARNERPAIGLSTEVLLFASLTHIDSSAVSQMLSPTYMLQVVCEYVDFVRRIQCKCPLLGHTPK